MEATLVSALQFLIAVASRGAQFSGRGSSVVAAPGLSCPEAFGSFPVRVNIKSLSHVLLFTTPFTVVYQAPPSMEFSRQEYWSVLLFPFPIARAEDV